MNRRDITLTITASLTTLGLLGWLCASNFLLYHTIAGIATAIVGFTVYTVAWNTRHIAANDSFSILGIGYLFISVLDLLHTLTFEGMPLFTDSGNNLAGQFWIAARFMQGFTFFEAAYVGVKGKNISHQRVALRYALVTVVLSVLIFSGKFPIAYDSFGWTPFKIVAEFAVISLMAVSAWLFWNANTLAAWGKPHLTFVLLALIAAEVILTFYTDDASLIAFVAHMFRLASKMTLYRGLVIGSLKHPYRIMFSDLSESISTMHQERHDILNDLTLASGYIQMDKPDVALQCIQLVAADLSDKYNYYTLPKDAWHHVIINKKEQAQAKGVRFDYRLSAPLPDDSNQRRLLPKLVSNLLDNAIDAVTGVDDPWITVEWAQERPGMVLSVSNSGPPIPKHVQPKLFEPGISTKGSERGWGLVICRKIATELGGTLAVESTAHCTTFAVHLPRRTQAGANEFIIG